MSGLMDIPVSNEWHVLKGEHQYGPYSYMDMVQMKQNNLLFDFDYVWSPDLEEWTLAGDLAEFSMDRMSRLAEAAEDSEAIKQRNASRIHCDIDCLVHDDSRLWKGRVQNLSEGGALVLMDNPLLLPGHVLTLHFRAVGGIDKRFNSTVQILNKRLVKSKIQHDTAIHYVVKFLDLSDTGKEQLQSLIQKEAAPHSEKQQKSS